MPCRHTLSHSRFDERQKKIAAFQGTLNSELNSYILWDTAWACDMLLCIRKDSILQITISESDFRYPLSALEKIIFSRITDI